MYDPVKDGLKKHIEGVLYNEAKPPPILSDVVHCFWEMKTKAPLKEAFTVHAIPDACTNILFNQQETHIAGITALKTRYTELNLGKDFNYAGIQLFPGVWQGNGDETKDSFVGTAYTGDMPLIDINIQTAPLSFEEKQPIFAALILSLMSKQIVIRNPITHKILSQLETLTSVSEMAALTHLSPRQLQRNLKSSTGFSPHDFLKVMRLQQSLKQHNLDRYTDQSHFIRSFKAITGYTPSDYYKKYDV